MTQQATLSTAKVNVENGPKGIAITTDGTKIHVANSGNDSVPGSTVSVIDTATNTVTTTVNMGSLPLGIAVTPDGTKVYVINLNTNNVYVINTTTNTVSATVPVGSQPYRVSVTQDGKKVDVMNEDGTVSAIDTATNTAA